MILVPRRPPVRVLDDGNRCQVPGAYEAVLRTVCEQDCVDLSFELTEEALVPVIAAEHYVAEVVMVEEAIEKRRGETLVAQGWQLPCDDLPPGWLNRFPRNAVQCFTADPSDVITHLAYEKG